LYSNKSEYQQLPLKPRGASCKDFLKNKKWLREILRVFKAQSLSFISIFLTFEDKKNVTDSVTSLDFLGGGEVWIIFT